MKNNIETGKRSIEKSLKDKAVILLTSAAIAGSGIFAGCGGENKSPEPTKTTVENEQPDTKESQTTLSESEVLYAEYSKTLTEEQKRVNESLSPDLLAKMTDAEITEAFKIRFEEVATDGKIDPEKYAKSLAIRLERMCSAGASYIEYDKWGGINNSGYDNIGSGTEIVDKYEQLIIDGIYGKGRGKPKEGSNTYVLAINRSVLIDSENSHYGLELERYKLRFMVMDGSVQSTINADGSLDITFDCHSIDNWNNEVLDEHFYQKLTPINLTGTLSITGLHITDEGIVIPEHWSDSTKTLDN